MQPWRCVLTSWSLSSIAVAPISIRFCTHKQKLHFSFKNLTTIYWPLVGKSTYHILALGEFQTCKSVCDRSWHLSPSPSTSAFSSEENHTHTHTHTHLDKKTTPPVLSTRRPLLSSCPCSGGRCWPCSRCASTHHIIPRWSQPWRCTVCADLGRGNVRMRFSHYPGPGSSILPHVACNAMSCGRIVAKCLHLVHVPSLQ